MEKLVEVQKLKTKLTQEKKKNKQLEYDLSRMEYLLGETMIMLNTIAKRANTNGDSFTTLWCDTMLKDITKTLDLPRFGVDLITWNQIKDTK